jgi:ABC-type nitrate/sulfonate/bicarbonate transport system ATPase subunit
LQRYRQVARIIVLDAGEPDANEPIPVIQRKMTLPEVREAARRFRGGMRRRVEIIRALINHPKVLLMDEPFRALDALTKSVMHEFLLRLCDSEPYTIFFITHDLIEAIYLGDTVSVMSTRPGRIKCVVDIDAATAFVPGVDLAESPKVEGSNHGGSA